MRLWGKQDEADRLREKLHSLTTSGHKRLLLNMSNVERIDSRGIGCLARCHATAITSDVEITLVMGPGTVLDALKQLNFVRMYPVYPDEASALGEPRK